MLRKGVIPIPANELIPYKEPGSTFTAKASGAIIGKRFVEISADRTGGGGGGAEGSVTVGVGLSTDAENIYVVKQAAAKAAAVGVSGWDAADKAELKVFGRGHGIIVPIKAGTALTAGWEVEANAEGEAIKLAAGKALGLVLNKAAEGKDAEILLY